MKDKRLLLGVIVSVLWLAFAAYMLCAQKHPTELNAWGDFFAGFFAPLAFLWLVLGYLQQGEELKASTEALRLQAEELKNSVQQQSELVAVSRIQVQQELMALEEERERRRDAARPKFVPQHSTTTQHGPHIDFTLKLVNVGNTATRFRMRFDPELENPGPVAGGSTVLRFHNMALVSRDEVITVKFRGADQPIDVDVTITYCDADSFPGEVKFTMHANDRKLVLGEVERIV
jgi:hypothetical protein